MPGLINLGEQASKPTAPASGKRSLYAKSDGIYAEDSSGVETKLSNGGLTVKTITATETLTAADSVVLCNNTSNIDVNLPAVASSLNVVYYLGKVNSGTATATIDPSGAELINGQSTLILYLQDDWVRIICDGTSWHVMSDDRISHRAGMSRDAAQSIPHATFTKILFDGETFDKGEIADEVTNDRFDIRRSGEYLITCNWTADFLDGTEQCKVAIYKNGTNINEAMNRNPGITNSTLTAGVSIQLDLVSGDFIEMYVLQTEGASQNTVTSEHRKPKMTIHEVR